MKNFKIQQRNKIKKIWSSERCEIILIILAYIVLLLLYLMQKVNINMDGAISIVVFFVVGQKIYYLKLLKIPTEKKVKKYFDFELIYTYGFIAYSILFFPLLILLKEPISTFEIIFFLIILVITIAKVYKMITINKILR